MSFKYETLKREFWYHTDPIEEAERLIALHDEVYDALGEDSKKILEDSKKVAKKSVATQGDPRYADKLLVLAKINHALGSKGRAFEQIRLILSFDPDHLPSFSFLKEIADDNNPAPILRASAFKLLAQYRNTLEDRLIERALLLADRALEHDTSGEDERTYYLMAAIYRDSGNAQMAYENLANALRCDIDHEPSQKLLVRLERDGAVIAVKDRSELPYRPSPAGSPIAEFMAEFHETHNWHLEPPDFG